MNDKNVYVVICDKIIIGIFSSKEIAFCTLPQKDEFTEVTQSVRTFDGEEAMIPTKDNFYLDAPIYVHVEEHTEYMMGFPVEYKEETSIYEIKEFNVK